MKLATLTRFLAESGPNPPRLYHASPSRILSRFLSHRIILTTQQNQRSEGEVRRVREAALEVGLEVSLRTVQRILAGRIPAAGEVTVDGSSGGRDLVGEKPSVALQDDPGGPILSVGAEDLAEIRAVLGRAAGSSYLELAGLEVEARPGEVILRARVYEREDEYE